MELKHGSDSPVKGNLSETSSQKTKNIVYVDSDIISYTLVSIILSKGNFKLSYARSGQEVIQLIKQNSSFDLVITELRLPDMNGFELLSEIRKIAPAIPLIGLAFSLHDIKCQCTDDNFDCIIEKPIDIEQFVDKVEKCMCLHVANKNSDNL